MHKSLLVSAAKNGHAIACEIDVTKFLLSYPRGAYTSARTVNHTRIFDYEGHIKRLVESTIALHQPNFPNVLPLQVEALLRPRTEETLHAAMDNFKHKFGCDREVEYKITVLVCDATNTLPLSQPPLTTLMNNTDIYCHIGLMPPLRSAPVKLQVAGLPRQNAAAKDTAWVRDRKALYDAMPNDVEEIILMNPKTNQLLEGSQTNFYTIENGVIHTADDGILNGTVRALVLDVCKEMEIPVVLEPPTLNNIDSWEGCFISSTSRLVLGAASIEYGPSKVKVFSQNTVLERLTQAVKAAVLKKSSPIF